MREIEVDLASVDGETVDLIVEAMADTIEGLALLEPSIEEIIVAVGVVFRGLMEAESGSMH